MPWNPGALILATRTDIFSPWQLCVHSTRHAAFAQVSSAEVHNRHSVIHVGLQETKDCILNLDSPKILEEAKYLCSFEIRCSEEILTCSALCEETQGSSADTGFKATSEFPHLYGTDGSGSGSRVLTAPLKML